MNALARTMHGLRKMAIPRRRAALALASIAVVTVACGGADDGRIAADTTLSELTVQASDLPDFFTRPQTIDNFPLPEAIDFAVDAKFFVGSQDGEAGLAMEFLVSGAATIAIDGAVDDFFADPDTFILAALADIGRDLDTVQIVPLENLGDDAVAVVYFPAGAGRQDIIIFRRGGLLGYVGLFKPIEYPGAIDIGRAAAVMDGRFAAARARPARGADP